MWCYKNCSLAPLKSEKVFLKKHQMQLKRNWNSSKEEQEMEQKTGLRWCSFGEIFTLTCGRWIFCVPSALRFLWQEESKETRSVLVRGGGLEKTNPGSIHSWKLIVTWCGTCKQTTRNLSLSFWTWLRNNSLHLTNWWRWNKQVKLWKNRRIELSHCALSRSCFFFSFLYNSSLLM